MSVSRPSLWRHQGDMVEFAKGRPGTIWDCCMGGGKSYASVHYLDNDVKADIALIVAPKSVVQTVWSKEFKKYSDRPWRVVQLTQSSNAARIKCIHAEGKKWRSANKYPLALVINWESLRCKKIEDLLTKIRFDAAIFDELHVGKGPKAKQSKAAARVASKIPRVVGMTGTLLPHSPLDLWAQMKIVAPEVFGRSYYKFCSQYAVKGGFKGKAVVGFRNTDEMMDRCKDVIFRVSEEDAKLNLPDLRDEFVELDMSKEGKRMYDEMKTDMVAFLKDGGSINAGSGMTKRIRLMQLMSGVATVDELNDLGEIVSREIVMVDTAKEDYLAEMFEGSGGVPVVCFCLFTPEIALVHAAAERAGVTISERSGKAHQLEEWQNGETQVLVMQISAGATGIDLTRASIGVFLSPGNSLGDYEQVRKRIHRHGQKSPVLYKHLICKGTMAKDIYRGLAERKDINDSILELLSK